ncbi:hypothetical protein HHK36_005654 [Tetracentron sinense]|uniref:Bromo domain-containing protein n=1 Tax=Tetracentron sinense TaxID=13715 RepID=A0A835DR86_TETSI|nr:hypothetical protein HHK36_005654 [Tetracentron sinense]
MGENEMAKKKKGRPSKADLARRDIRRDPSPPPGEADLRRSLRRRNLTYDGFDDYDDEEERKRKREKKPKLVLKLPNKAGFGRVDSSQSVTRSEATVAHPSISASSSESGNGNKPFKKRRIDEDDVLDGNGNGNGDGDGDSDNSRLIGSGDQNKERGRNGDSKGMDSVLGTASDSPSGVPLPDKKSLELILDKLQNFSDVSMFWFECGRKDTYGVYAEPVNPEEVLPDYHDVIEHPMDFGTLRKKLVNGAYSNVEQFEVGTHYLILSCLCSFLLFEMHDSSSDVFLICTNAMQYNAPDTIYFKQAHSIQELARKKFQRLRVDLECSEVELKSEPKTKSDSLAKKPTKKSLCRTAQEPVRSDFSTGATLATVGDNCTWLIAMQGGGCEGPSNIDSLIDGNSSLTDNKLEKAEELLSGMVVAIKIKDFILSIGSRFIQSQYSEDFGGTQLIICELSLRITVYTQVVSGKGLLSKFGRKLFVPDENRRATYNIYNQLVVGAESLFTTFVDEKKQLIAVGLHADHSYARSLARFASTLGPVAWKVASRRRQQALPMVMLENHTYKQRPNGTNMQCTAELPKDDKIADRSNATQHDVKLDQETLNSSRVIDSCKTPDPAKEHLVSGLNIEGKLGLFGVAGTKHIVNAMPQQQNQPTMNFAKSDNNELKQSSASGKPVEVTSRKQLLHSSEMATSRLLEMVSRNRNHVQSVPFMHPETSGVVAEEFPNGKAMSSSDCIRVSSSSSEFVSNQLARAVVYSPRGSQEQGLSEPVQLMRMLAEKAQNQQKYSNHSTVDIPQVMPPVQSSKRNNSSTAATADAQAWMSIGASRIEPTGSSSAPKTQIASASWCNPSQELTPSISRFGEESPVSGTLQLQPKNRLPRTFLPEPARIGYEALSQNSRPMVSPQPVMTDLSRYQLQSPWRSLSPHTQPKQKQETLPPDLNIGFQVSGSPVRQSSGTLVDSQQPDLALQL